MSKNKTKVAEKKSTDNTKRVSKKFWRKLGGIEKLGVLGLCLLLGVGVMASGLGNSIVKAFAADSKSGNSANASEPSLFSKLNPFASSEPMPSNTPQLSKSYIYAGSRMLAVEDAGASNENPADLAIWRPSTGTWWVLDGDGSHTAWQWGDEDDVPMPGDFDGDGKTDFSIFQPKFNQWWFIRSTDGSTGAISFGTHGDKTAPADYDGDGITDFAVYRPSDTNWYIWQSSTNSMVVYTFGLSTDIPAAADYDGDGKADIGVWRDSNKTFYSVNTSNGALGIATFTQNSTQPVSGDYDGDGRADYAIRSGADWIILNSSTGQFEPAVSWQSGSDRAGQNDYDGDGRIDIATWKDTNGTWYIRNSSDLSTRTTQWGMTGDIPVPAYYRR